MSVILWVGSDVLEDERARRSHDQHLEHEVVECFKEDGAKCLGLDRLTVVISEELRSVREGISCHAPGQIHFKLVSDAFDT